MSVTALIPARSGSRGLKNKNIKLLFGKPLIWYTINPCLKSELIDKVVVSTDSEKYANICRELGAEVPFLRPKHLASAGATTESVLKNYIEWLEKSGEKVPEIIVYMQPTDIFRKKKHVDQCIKNLLDDKTLDSSFVAFQTHKKFWREQSSTFERVNEGIYPARQRSEVLYREDTGVVLATRPSVIKSNRRIGDNVKIVVNDDEHSGIDIHTEESFYLAE